MFVCMPAASPAGLPETFLGADFRSTEPFQRLARPPLVEQLPRRGVALGGAAQGVRGGALVALGEQQLGARLRYRRRPGAAPPEPAPRPRARSRNSRARSSWPARAHTVAAATW